jgi:hypothetical protein
VRGPSTRFDDGGLAGIGGHRWRQQGGMGGVCALRAPACGRPPARTLTAAQASQRERPSKSSPPFSAHMGRSVLLSPLVTCMW